MLTTIQALSLTGPDGKPWPPQTVTIETLWVWNPGSSPSGSRYAGLGLTSQANVQLSVAEWQQLVFPRVLDDVKVSLSPGMHPSG